MVLLRLVEIIGEDELSNIGTETLNLIVSVLNLTNMDSIRNKVLFLNSLPPLTYCNGNIYLVEC